MLYSFQLPVLALIFLTPILLSQLTRPRDALWLSWGLGIHLAPDWLVWHISAGVAIDSRVMITLGCFVALAIKPRPGPTVRMRWRLVDSLLILCMLSMLVSEVLNQAAGFFAPFVIFLYWGLPYLLGRRFLRSPEDIGRFAKTMGVIIAVTTAFAFLEAVTNKNLLDHLFGHINVLQEVRGETTRMGFRRAKVNLDMPLCFGMLMVLVMPWSLLAARQPGRAAWRRWLPAINVGAACCSLSRGPIAMCLLAWAIAIFFRKPRLRPAMAGVAIVGTLFIMFALQSLLDLSAQAIGDGNSSTVVINGRVEGVNSTRQRALMREAYAPALADGGLFGFGSEKLLTIPAIYKIPAPLVSVESHYILHQLGTGLVGLATFNLFAAAILYTLARVAWRPRGDIEDLAGALAGAHVGVLIGVLSVYFPDSFRFIWLFNAGLAANLMDLHAKQKAALGRLQAAAAVKPPPMPPL